MSNKPNATDFFVEELPIEDESTANNFEFTIGPDGELCSMIIPEHMMDDLPEEVALILQMYGIEDLNTLDNRILH